MKKILYIDMDGVLADFAGELFGKHPHLLTLDTTPAAAAVDSSVSHPDSRSPQSVEIDWICENKYRNIFQELKPIEGAVKAFKLLCKHYDVYILSTPMWNLPESYTDKRNWIEGWLGHDAYKKLILTHNKGLCSGDYLIDDRIKNGVENFKGIHIHFGQGRWPDWNSTLEYLSQMDGWELEPAGV